ncbi:MMPL family transporter [Rhodococcoides yunnanense]|uniref:MMPL family transporter n=1 Tax=Rhodococcoides yunnanense TaxID=278209 RepID=A0ABU4B6K1_9NOCA|nr:MMPL family transporter [Rhodococcus yunnanensis]MDV6259815.1 MMPL family transporter [Rhodococcus yunnanensis]
MARLLYALGAFSFRHRLAVVAAWLVLLIGAAIGAAALAGETTSAYTIPGQESTSAQERIATEFGTGDGASAQVVIQAPTGEILSTPQNTTAVQSLVDSLGVLEGVVYATDPLDPAAPSVSPDQTVAYSTLTYRSAVGDITDSEREALHTAMDTARSSGLTVEATGDAVNEPTHLGGPAEIIGVVVALLVLALTYGSLAAAGMNLLTAVIGVGMGVLGIVVVSGFMDLQATTSVLAAMLGLAVGIDYALFIFTRFRQELRSGSDVAHAAATAVGTAGSAVVTAGITVVIALVGLSVAGIPFLTEMGVAAAATVVFAVLVAITLVPAALSYLGLRALPKSQRTGLPNDGVDGVEKDEAKPDGFYARWIGAISGNRVVALTLSVVVLGTIAVPILSMRTSVVQNPADGTTQAAAQAMLADSFGEGINGPLIVLLEGSDIGEVTPGISARISELPDVALVAGPQLNSDGAAAILTVVPQSGPTSDETANLVGDLRDLLATANDDVQGSVTGVTAVSVDVSQVLDSSLVTYLILVVGLALGLLILVFRSLLVPVVGVLGFLLTIAASLGATTAVFQWGWLGGLLQTGSTGPLLSLTPILVIGILFGLAMDYQVFLVSRMHEAHSRGVTAREAIVSGFTHAAPVVVAAAAIMFAVFAGFVPAGDTTIKQIAFALAVGIVFDAFVVRMILVPAALAMMGQRAWWLPGRLRWLPKIDVEGAQLQDDSSARHGRVSTPATQQHDHADREKDAVHP